MVPLPRTPFAALLAIVTLTGARPSDDVRVHPEFEKHIAGVKTLGLVQPTADAYELDARGTRVLRPDWTERAVANLGAALEKHLARRGFDVKRFEPATPAATEELREVKLLYEAVGSAIVQATIANQFPWKLDRFDYTVGDVGALAAAGGVDALVFVHAVANISSGGRVALQLLGAGGGIDWLIVSVVDRTGTVLWFARVYSTVSDVREPDYAALLVEQATNRLPRKAR